MQHFNIYSTLALGYVSNRIDESEIMDSVLDGFKLYEA